MMKKNRKFIALTLALFTFGALAFAGVAQDTRKVDDGFWGPAYNARPSTAIVTNNASLLTSGNTTGLRRWNEIAVNASGLDHTPVGIGENRVFGEQLGPVRAARAMAIVHIAIFEVMNALGGSRFASYLGIPAVKTGGSVDAALAQAAHDTLIAVFPSQTPAFDQLLAEDLALIPNGFAKTNGISLGKNVAKQILLKRLNDGSAHPELLVNTEFICSNDPYKWRQDPISLIPLALGANWQQVTPFVMSSAHQFRIPPPPALTSPRYTAAFNEVKALGGDGVITPTSRTADQTEAGIYWAYDGTPSLCAPPRLYNQIAVHIANQMGTSDLDLGRLLALLHVAMADAGIASWESKYFYQIWRPVGGVREADPGSGPSGMGDGNPDTIGDPTYSPLGAPASNLNGPNFTPPFPAYPSGHATFGGALFQLLRKFYGTDNITFTFVSDELNGITEDNQGQIRPLRPRTFTTLSQAEEENGQSRIYLGIHWEFDKTEGIKQGRNVTDHVFKRIFQRK